MNFYDLFVDYDIERYQTTPKLDKAQIVYILFRYTVHLMMSTWARHGNILEMNLATIGLNMGLTFVRDSVFRKFELPICCYLNFITEGL